jgi:hypothetical protein
MLLVKRIINYAVVTAFFLSIYNVLQAQENSPYSRYGLGDMYPSQSISSRAMGSLTAAYSDNQALNADNPATYGDLRSYVNGGLVTFDVGTTIDTRTLHSTNPVNKYNSAYFIPSYILIGFPLSKKHWGMVAGLRPMTRVNYSIESFGRVVDTLQTLYEGSGGINQAFVGIGKRWGAFSFGVNGGYLFGKKEISTKKAFLNDSVLYYNSNVDEQQNFGGLYANVGAQLNIKLGTNTDSLSKIKSTHILRLGAAGMFKQNINVTSDILNETFTYGTAGVVNPQDTVSYRSNASGKVVLPAMFNVGVMFIDQQSFLGIANDNKWMGGVEMSVGKWGDQYQYPGKTEPLTNSWMLRGGVQFVPAPFSATSGFVGHTIYRFGFYTGKDYMEADGHDLRVAAFTFGAGFRVRKFNSYTNQSSIINTSFEIGKRGSNVNNITESFFKFSVGLSLSDIWFIKRKYD